MGSNRSPDQLVPKSLSRDRKLGRVARRPRLGLDQRGRDRFGWHERVGGRALRRDAATDADHNASLIAFYLSFGDIMSTEMLIGCLERNAGMARQR